MRQPSIAMKIHNKNELPARGAASTAYTATGRLPSGMWGSEQWKIWLPCEMIFK
jgi:hypothetical protein